MITFLYSKQTWTKFFRGKRVATACLKYICCSRSQIWNNFLADNPTKWPAFPVGNSPEINSSTIWNMPKNLIENKHLTKIPLFPEKRREQNATGYYGRTIRFFRRLISRKRLRITDQSSRRPIFVFRIYKTDKRNILYSTKINYKNLSRFCLLKIC